MQGEAEQAASALAARRAEQQVEAEFNPPLRQVNDKYVENVYESLVGQGALPEIRLATTREHLSIGLMSRGQAEPRTGPAPLPEDGLWGAVRDLPAKQREAIVHRYVLDLDYAQIADRMGISPEAARQNVSTGLRRLRLEVDR